MKKFIKLFILLLVVIPGIALAKNPSDYEFYKKEKLNISYVQGVDSVSDGYLISGVFSSGTTSNRIIYKTNLDGKPIAVYQDDVMGMFLKAFEHNNKYYVLSYDLNDGKIIVTEFDKELSVIKNTKTDYMGTGLVAMGKIVGESLFVTTLDNDDGTVKGVQTGTNTFADYMKYDMTTGTATATNATADTPDLVARLRAVRTQYGGIATNYAENSKYFITVGVLSNDVKGGHLMSFYNKSTSQFESPIGNNDSYIMYSDVELIDNYAYVVAVNESNIGAYNLDGAKEEDKEILIDTKSHLDGSTISINGIASEKNGFAVVTMDCVGTNSDTCQYNILVYKDKDTLASLNKEVIKGSEKVDKNPDTGVFTYVAEVGAVIAVCLAGLFVVQKTRKFKNM